MRRVFYFSSMGMKVFEWRTNELLGSMYFANNESGHDEFEMYLKMSPPKFSQLLVDVIEEDFRRESIPHVNARDRKALINRLLDRHYRDELHHQVSLLDRDKSGRKDDQILLSALSNFDQIDPWVTRMNRQEVPLAGIWSVPLLAEELLKIKKYKDENTLLVTRELPWSQRETFFKNGRLIFSRLEKLECNLYDKNDIQQSLECLQNGAEQIRHFVTNQRIIGFVEPIKVVCLVPQPHTEVCINMSIDTPQLNYELLGIEDVLAHRNVKGCKNEADDAIFSWLCTNKNIFNDHYGTNKQKAFFYRFAIEKSIGLVSWLGALVFVTASALLWLDGVEIDKKVNLATQSTNNLQEIYFGDFGEIEDQLEDAYIIQNTVTHSELIKLEASETPQKYFVDLAGIYGQTIFEPVYLDEMHWFKYPRANIPQIVRELSGKRAGEEEYDETGGYYEEEEGAGLVTRMQPVVRLVGRLKRDNLPYRQTVLVMREFVNALKNLSMVSELHVVRTPVDIRPDARFSDKGGLEQDSHAKNENADSYEILLVIEPQREIKVSTN